MARLFVAAWPSPHIIETLAELHRPDEPGVRWTTHKQWHVTLGFMGDADPDDIVDALSEIELSAATATLGPRARRLGCQVVVVPVDGLEELARRVRSATDHLGERPDEKPFVGHITLARLLGGGPCGLERVAIDGSCTVDEIALVASETHPDGARYTELARLPLETP